MSAGPWHGAWWALMGLAACRLIALPGQLGLTFAVIAGLGDDRRVGAGWSGQGVPLASLLGGGATLLATAALQTAVLVAAVRLARPVPPLPALLASGAAAILLLAAPAVEGGLGIGSGVAVSGLGVEELTSFTLATSTLALLGRWLDVAPLLAALAAAVRLAHRSPEPARSAAAGDTPPA